MTGERAKTFQHGNENMTVILPYQATFTGRAIFDSYPAST